MLYFDPNIQPKANKLIARLVDSYCGEVADRDQIAVFLADTYLHESFLKKVNEPGHRDDSVFKVAANYVDNFARNVWEQYNLQKVRVERPSAKNRRRSIWAYRQSPSDDPAALPEEVLGKTPLLEGLAKQITVNAYERNPKARQQCIAFHGAKCCICGFSFKRVYGEVAEGYIHVHHITPLSKSDGERSVDPVEDLRPVCPNCHAVIHLGGTCRTIEEVRRLL